MLFIIKEAMESAGIRYQSISYRIKTFNSMVEKAERLSIAEPLTKMHDVVGLRVVCLFLSDVERIGQLLRQKFQIIKEDNKIEAQEVSSFGYMSHHFIAKMHSTYSGPRYEGLVGMLGEIQVRTIAMEAWATCSHFLDYKTVLAVPKELRRDFYALSGLFYVADRHFELFFRAREASREQATDRKPQSGDEINFDSLVAYMRSRFPDREHETSPVDISELVTELFYGEIRTLGQIDSLVDKHWDAFIGDEEKSPPLDEMGGKTRYMDIGVVRGLLYLERPDIREKYQFKGVIGRVMRRAKKKQRRGTNTKKDDDALG
jgi:ppGpp synthetase/RelA/SpoT-type nucleotidyltranferase